MKQVKLLFIALMLAVAGSANALTKAEIKELLEDFCVAYYNDYFSPRQYVRGTLVVTSVALEDDGTIKVNGTHTCKGQSVLGVRQTYPGRAFKADLIPTSSGLKIKFWRWYVADTPWGEDYWEGPCTKTVIY